MSGPTPCAEYDVRTLTNHLVLWTSHSLEARARGRSVPEEWQKRDFTADPDWAEAYRVQLDKAVAAWSDPRVWEEEMDLGGQTMPAEAVAGMNLMELVLHGWDLGRAIGVEYRLPEASAEHVLRLVEEHAAMYRQYGGFAEPVALSSAGADPLARAVALSGRDPGWKP
ncbi:TIGR03086 family metal-binding protein [Phaeacidiphilus oryzae]|uniref:TIGR03086 family metal-binding protein n=1 Tax=Phaeacidiphilus oryzae TaxID=348818 RepID=UPI002AFE35E6|nr:TIGR03086 family metal-binding protein [Phaeacidiphilus oryzae]